MSEQSQHDRSLMKWAMGAFLTILLTGFLALVGVVFSIVNQKADQGVEANRKVGLVEKEQGHIKEDIGDVKEGQKTIVEGMQTIIETLYTLPSERRANPKPILEEPPE